MSQHPMQGTILPERRGWLRRRAAAPTTPTPPAAGAAESPAPVEATAPRHLAGQDWPDDVSGLSALERMAMRAPEIAAREAADRRWREEEDRRAAEEAANKAAERERRLREESLDMAERLASLAEQRRPFAEWDAGPQDGRTAS